MNKMFILFVLIVMAGGTLDVVTSYWMLSLGYIETNPFGVVLPFVLPVFSLGLEIAVITAFKHSVKRRYIDFTKMELYYGKMEYITLIVISIYLIVLNWYGGIHNLLLFAGVL